MQLKDSVSYRDSTVFLKTRKKTMELRRVYGFHVSNRVSKHVSFDANSKETFGGFGGLEVTANICSHLRNIIT